MQLKLLSPLAKVFPDEAPQNPLHDKFSMLNNERKSFQLAFFCEKEAVLSLEIVSPLAEAVKVYQVGLVPSVKAGYPDSDDFTLRGNAPGLYPDVLRPVEGSVSAYAGWQSLWVEILPEGAFAAGEYPIELRLNGASARAQLTILELALPEQALICTFWYHTDSLMTWYGFEAFSEAYWQAVEAYARTAAEHGINMLLTPLFTPPLDTQVGGERPTVQLVDVERQGSSYRFGFDKLARWVEMCERAGIRYFEMSHLFTQWGARHAPKIMATVEGEYRRIFGWETRASGKAYKEFLRQFAAALIAFLDEKGIRSRCMFHTSDEPSRGNLRSYKKAAGIVNGLFGAFPTIDALSNYKFYQKGLVQTPIPANSHIEAFIGRVPALWVYYCSGQRKNYVSNRFFAMPSQRNRIIGWQMYKYDVQGFLHWGYNFWFTQHAKRPVNPFEESDAGGAFASGDSYVVYPGADGKPLTSLTLKVFYDALQDMRALQLLEQRMGRAAVIALIERDSGGPLTFSQYPHEEAWLLNKREEINQALGDVYAP